MPARHRHVPADVRRLLRAGRGVIAGAEAQRLGVSAERIRRLHRAELLVRLARDVYADAEEFGRASAWERFALRSRAFTLSCGPGAYAAGWSAAAILGLPTISAPPELPVVVTAGTSSANSRYGVVRTSALPARHRSYFQGARVTPLPRTIVDIARASPRPDSLVAADAALARANPAVVEDVLSVQAGWPGIEQARWTIRHADPHAESALETLGRLTFVEYDLPVPVSNAWVAADR